MSFSGIPQHIIQRVDYNFKCFYKTEDLQNYLNLLEEISYEEDVSVHAYALLNDHVHLLVSSSRDDSVPAMIKLLGQHYTSYFNREYCRKGRLWGERYRPSLIDAGTYLLACQRYIELSPVRAGIVTHPAEYIWSSYSINALGERTDFLRSHPVYEALGRNKAQRIETYRQLFRYDPESSLLDEISEHVIYGYCLGSDEFKLEVETMLGRRKKRDGYSWPAEKLQLRSY